MIKKRLRKFFKPVFPLLDVLFSPFTLLASLLLYFIRKMRVVNMPVSKWIFKTVGVFPITNHYYEPLFDDRHLKLDRAGDAQGPHQPVRFDVATMHAAKRRQDRDSASPRQVAE